MNLREKAEARRWTTGKQIFFKLFKEILIKNDKCNKEKTGKIKYTALKV